MNNMILSNPHLTNDNISEFFFFFNYNYNLYKTKIFLFLFQRNLNKRNALLNVAVTRFIL